MELITELFSFAFALTSDRQLEVKSTQISAKWIAMIQIMAILAMVQNRGILAIPIRN